MMDMANVRRDATDKANVRRDATDTVNVRRDATDNSCPETTPAGIGREIIINNTYSLSTMSSVSDSKEQPYPEKDTKQGMVGEDTWWYNFFNKPTNDSSTNTKPTEPNTKDLGTYFLINCGKL